jgi:hypothetical protein
MIATPIDSGWTENDFTFVEADETHAGLVARYILEYNTATPPALNWVFAYTMGAEEIPL